MKEANTSAPHPATNETGSDRVPADPGEHDSTTKEARAVPPPLDLVERPYLEQETARSQNVLEMRPLSGSCGAWRGWTLTFFWGRRARPACWPNWARRAALARLCGA